MLKTSKVTKPKSTRTKLKSKIITTTTTTTSLSNCKLQHRIGFINITKKTLSKPPSPIIIPSSLQPSISSSTFSSTKSSSSSLSLTLPISSTISSSSPSSSPLATATSSSLSQQGLLSVLKSISLPFTTIFNLCSQQQSPQQQQQQQQQQLPSITSHPQQLHHKHNNEQFDPTPFPHNLVSQLMTSFLSTKVQLARPAKKQEPATNAKATTKPKSSKKATKATTTTNEASPPDVVVVFKHLNSDEFQAAMEEFESEFLEFVDDLNIPLSTFIAAVEEHYPSKPLGSVANFIRVNRVPFQQLFQYQIIKSIPSLNGAKKTKQNEIVQIIFDWYQDITTLILKLRGKGYTDAEIGTLLRQIYPKHFHSKINTTLSPQIRQFSQFDDQGTFNGIHYFIKQQPHRTDTDKASFLKDFTKIQTSLTHFEPVNQGINTTLEQFATIFCQSPIIKRLLTAHDVTSINNINSNTFYFSSQDVVHEMNNELDTSWSPQLQLINFPITLSARVAIDFKEELEKLPTKDTIHHHITTFASTLSQNIFPSTSTTSSSSLLQQPDKFYINPIADNHLAFSYQQCLLLTTADFIINKYLNQPTTNEQELIFQFTTGQTYDTFCTKCIQPTSDQHLNPPQLPCFVGPTGLGKSILLFIIWLKHVHRSIQNKMLNDIIVVAFGDDEDKESYIRAYFFWSDDGTPTVMIDDQAQSIQTFINTNGKNVIYLNDLPDSKNARYNAKKVFSQTNRDKLPAQSSLHHGVELQLVSAQEQFPYPTTQYNQIQHGKRRSDAARRIKYATPLIFIPTPPSYPQTLLSLLKSSLFRHRFPHLVVQRTLQQNTITLKPNAEGEVDQYLKSLNELTIQDLFNNNLFNEWDDGKSLFGENDSVFNSSNTDAIFERPRYSTLSFYGFKSLFDEQYNKSSNENQSQDNIIASQNRFNEILQQTFQLSPPPPPPTTTTTDNNTQQQQQLQFYQDSIFKQLRLLPYVSPSMRSASTLYRQIQNPAIPLLRHYDFLTRYIPISFECLDQKVKQDEATLESITSLTQFSEALKFASPKFFKDFFKLAIHRETAAPADGLAYQSQFDIILTLYNDETMRYYSNLGFTNAIATQLGLSSDLHFDITLQHSTTPDQLTDQFARLITSGERFRAVTIYVDLDEKDSIKKPIPQYKHVNRVIAFALKHLETNTSPTNTISFSISTSIASGYPVFDRALVYSKSANELLIAGVQETTNQTRTFDLTEGVDNSLTDLKKQIGETKFSSELFTVSPTPLKVITTEQFKTSIFQTTPKQLTPRFLFCSLIPSSFKSTRNYDPNKH